MSSADRLLRSVVTLLACDGRVGARERRFLDALRKRMGIAADVVEGYVTEALAGKRMLTLPAGEEERQELFEVLVDAAAVDRVIAVAERRILDVFATRIGVSREDLEDRIRAALEKYTPQAEKGRGAAENKVAVSSAPRVVSWRDRPAPRAVASESAPPVLPPPEVAAIPALELAPPVVVPVKAPPAPRAAVPPKAAPAPRASVAATSQRASTPASAPPPPVCLTPPARRGLLSWKSVSLDSQSAAPPRDLALAADGRFAVLAAADDALRLWDLVAGRCVRELATQGHRPGCVAIAPDGRLVLSGGEDGTVRAWDPDQGSSTATLVGHQGPVYGVHLTMDGRLAASAGADHTFRVWDLAAGRCLRTLWGGRGGLLAARISEDGRLAVSLSEDRTVRAWEAATGRFLRTLEDASRPVRALAMTPDGRRAAAGGDAGVLRVWHVATGRREASLEAHAGGVSDLALSVDGSLGVTAGADGLLRAWDLDRGELLAELTGHAAPVTRVSLSANGAAAVSASADGELRAWRLDREEPASEEADWDEAARGWVELFLSARTPIVDAGLTRKGRPSWTEADLRRLLLQLRWAGLGRLRPEGVRAAAEQLASSWSAPPALD
ncbi:MAG: hypothetical protein HYZ53_17565 [Planctomycetes bacterium]|nr:hypothetical protein [Planctomycetota bacterium]